MGKKIRAAFLLFLTAMIWGFAFVAQQYGAEGGISAFTFNAVRFTMGCVSLLPVVLIFESEKMTKEKWKKLAIGSLVGGSILFIASNLQQLGIEMGVSAGKAGFLTGTYTVLVPIIGFFFFKYKNNLCTWISAFLAVGGLFLINLDDGFNFKSGRGEIVLIVGAVFWALHIDAVAKFVKDIKPLKFSLGQFAVSAVLSCISAFIFEDNPINFADIGDNIISLLYCGVLSVGVAYTCQMIAQRDSSPAFAAIVFSAESVFSMIGQILILHIYPNFYGYAGCAVIFAAIIISQLDFSSFRRKDMIKRETKG